MSTQDLAPWASCAVRLAPAATLWLFDSTPYKGEEDVDDSSGSRPVIRLLCVDTQCCFLDFGESDPGDGGVDTGSCPKEFGGEGGVCQRRL